MSKPKVGIFFLSAEWFGTIGAGKGFYSKLPQLIEKEALKIKEKLGEEIEIVDRGIIITKEKCKEAAEKFKTEKIVLLIVCYLTWGEDWLLIDVTKRLPDVPLLLWNFTPSTTLPESFDMIDLFHFSGPVGTVQASGPLKRMGRKFGFVSGSARDGETINRIIAYARAAQVVSKLKKTVVGLLPSTCEQMSGTHVDESILKAQLGPEVRYISVKEYYNISQKISDSEIRKYLEELKNNYNIEVSEEALFKAARASLGLVKVVQEYEVDALALQDLSEELHEAFGLRPCLYVPSLFEKAVVSMEGDVGAAVALLILKESSGKSPMYTEIFTYDKKENTILAGHAGIHDINLAENKKDIRITPDYEYMEVEPQTAWMQFRAKAGKVILLSLFCDSDKFKMIMSSGKAIANKRKFDISPHIYIKLDIPLEEFFTQIMKSGTTQHWAVVHEDKLEKLIILAEILDLPVVILK